MKNGNLKKKSTVMLYSDADHPMNAVYEEMIKEPMFKTYSYEEIVWLIDNETKRRREVALITNIIAVPLAIAAAIFLPKLLTLLPL